MKVVQIFPGRIWGGAEQYILDLGKALEKRGHEVVYLSRDSKAVKRRLEGNVSFMALPFRGALDICSAISLSRIVRKTMAEVIHVHDKTFVPLAIAAVWLSGRKEVKVVFTRHIARASRVNFVFRRMFKKLHSIIFVSDLSKRLWTSVNGWMPEGKCRVVHNSIPETDKAEGESLREKYGIPKRIPLIVYSGRVRRSKGCAVLVKALGRIRELNFALVFVGACKPEGYSRKLWQLAEKSGIGDRVFFYGFSENVRSFIRDADIGVAPSIVREACPLSPMEFMQAGKCVIATNNGAQPEYMAHRVNGLLVAPGDESCLADALREAIERPQWRERLGESAKSYFERSLSYDKFVNLILDSYR